ncbi:MAG: hypothetical protein L0Y56_04680 [Nitrospira sp.]|nr:hypothetical protein [Nitrospira sp.]
MIIDGELSEIEKMIEKVENVSISRPERFPGEIQMVPPRSSAHALLKHAGTWVGGDLEKCLKDVYAVRGEGKV